MRGAARSPSVRCLVPTSLRGCAGGGPGAGCGVTPTIGAHASRSRCVVLAGSTLPSHHRHPYTKTHASAPAPSAPPLCCSPGALLLHESGHPARLHPAQDAAGPAGAARRGAAGAPAPGALCRPCLLLALSAALAALAAVCCPCCPVPSAAAAAASPAALCSCRWAGRLHPVRRRWWWPRQLADAPA